MSTEMTTTSAPRRRLGLPILLGLVVLLVVLGIWFVSAGNRLVGLQEDVNTAWAQVETVLQRRFDLIPNLVEIVKGYAAHEKEILTEVTRLRSQWGQARTPEQQAQVGSQLEGALGRLLLVAERYPDLKANQNFRDLQVELSGTENRIVVERQRYNEVARGYNTAVRRFPTSLVASLRGFDYKPYFEGSKAAQEAPKIDFSKPEK